MGHIGLTPQSATMLGGYKAQGRSAAARLIDEALALERAGCFSIVLEAVPGPVASGSPKRSRSRRSASAPAPGRRPGARLARSARALPGSSPRFVKRYADLATTIRDAVSAYAADVRERRFPEDVHTYGIPEEELEAFRDAIGAEDTIQARRSS